MVYTSVPAAYQRLTVSVLFFSTSSVELFSTLVLSLVLVLSDHRSFLFSFSLALLLPPFFTSHIQRSNHMCCSPISRFLPLAVFQSSLSISPIKLCAVLPATCSITYQCQVINNSRQFRDFSSTTGMYSAELCAALLA